MNEVLRMRTLTVFFAIFMAFEGKYGDRFLEPGKNIDSDHLLIVTKARELTTGLSEPTAMAKAFFEFVRDEIDEGNAPAFKASVVLQTGAGLCYHKSILLVALCRAGGIPARLGFDEVWIKDWQDDRHSTKREIRFLHGIAQLRLKGRWIRYDPTGNLKRWLIWSQGDPPGFPLPLAFQADQDVVFPSRGRIAVSRTNYRFFDWTKDIDLLIKKVNVF
jgi:hypothetical protein